MHSSFNAVLILWMEAFYLAGYRFCYWTKPCLEKHMAVHPTWKKENNSVEKDGFLYASLPPPSCKKQGK